MPSSPIAGLDSILANLSRIHQEIRIKADAAIESEMQAILDDSKSNHVPVEHGTLRDGGVLVESSGPSDSGTIERSIAFGTGDSAPYALAIHENPSSHDPRSWRVHQARGEDVHFTTGGHKYLEIPLMQAADGLTERLASKIKVD